MSEAELKYLELLRKPVKNNEEVLQMNYFSDLFEEELSLEVKRLVLQLNELGLNCTDVWDLVNMKEKYPSGVVELLLEHVPKNYHQKNREGIIRALTVKEAKGKATPALISEYEKTPVENDHLRWVIGNAIAVVMTFKDLDWIYNTVTDRRNGFSRSRMVLALGTVKTERSEQILIDLLDDEQVAPQALTALGKLRSSRAKDKILYMRENTSDPLIRLEASKALKKIDY